MNPSYLLEQFRLISDYVGRARGIGSRQREEFLADPVLIDAAVRELTVLFETSHNIAKHLISSLALREASSKAEAFEVLAENGVITKDLCDAFREAARFRNLVTYQTTIVDEEIVYEILSTRVGDFEAFTAQVARWLELRNPTNPGP